MSPTLEGGSPTRSGEAAPEPEIVIGGEAQRTACIGETVTWTAEATAVEEGAEVTYQWFKNDQALEGKTELTLTLTNITAEDAGTYVCRMFVKTTTGGESSGTGEETGGEEGGEGNGEGSGEETGSDEGIDANSEEIIEEYTSAAVTLTVPQYEGGLPETTEAVAGVPLTLSVAEAERAIFEWAPLSTLFFEPSDKASALFQITPPEREETVRVKVTIDGCVFRDSTTIRITTSKTRTATVTIPATKTACAGEEVELTASVEEPEGQDAGDYVYSWFREGSDEPVGTAATLTFSATESGNYFCRVYDQKYGLTFQSSGVCVLTVPHYAGGLAKTTAAVIGVPLKLSVAEAEGATYKWTLSTSSSLSDPSNASASFYEIDAPAPPERDETVTVEVTIGGCTFTESTTVQIRYSTEEVTVAATGRSTACVGESFAFDAGVSRPGHYSYQWFREGVDEPVATTKELAFTSVTAEQNGRYFCKVYDNTYQLTYTSDVLPLTVSGYPDVSVSATTTTPCYEALVKLTATDATGGEGVTWRWHAGGESLGDAVELEMQMLSETAVTYWAVAERGGCRDSASVTLTPIVPLVDLPEKLDLVIGNSITITNTYQSGASYAWTVPVVFSNYNHYITFTGTTACDRVILQVTYGGCTRRDTTVLEQTHAEKDVKATMKGYTRACVADAVDYQVTASGGSGSYDYKWRKVGTDEVYATARTYSIAAISLAEAGEYYCEVYDRTYDLTFYSDTITTVVYEYPKPTVQVNGTTSADGRWTFCRGEEVVLEAGEADGRSDMRYLWMGDGLTMTPGSATARATVSDSAVYRVMADYNGCLTEDTIRIYGDRPEVDLPEEHHAFAGETLTVRTAERDGYSYSWSGASGGTAAGAAYAFAVTEGVTTVKVEVTNAAGCKAEAETTINGWPAMNYVNSEHDGYAVSREPLRIVQSDTTICARSPLTLEVAYTGSDQYYYEWLRGVQVVATGRVYAIPAVGTDHAGTYHCRVLDVESGGYWESDPVTVKVVHRPEAKIVTDVETAFCAGAEMTFTGSDALGGSELTYAWSGTDVVSGREEATMTALAGRDGTYRLTVSHAGCHDTTEVTVQTIVEHVDIPANLTLAQPTKAVPFEVVSSGGDSYAWYVNGELQSVSGTRVTFDLNQMGTVVVEMQKNGCTFADTCRVSVRPFYAQGTTEDDGFASSSPILRVKEKEIYVCKGMPFSMSLFYMGYDLYEYEWRRVDDYNTVLSDSITYYVESATEVMRGKYYCRAFNADLQEYINSDTLEVFVEAGPVATIEDWGIWDVCFGQEVKLVSTTPYALNGFSEDPGVADRLEWIGEGIISGQGTQELTAIIGDNPQYTLRAIKENGCSSEVSIRFNVTKPEVRLPHLLHLTEGREIEFEAERSMKNLDVSWYVNGELKDKSGSKVVLNIEETGTVVAEMKSGEGCLTRDTCFVFVKTPGTFGGGENDGFIVNRPKPFVPTELKYVNVCPDSVVTLRVSHADYPYFKYEWFKLESEGDRLVAEGKAFTFNALPESTGYYYCRVLDPDNEDGKNYIYSDTLQMTVYAGAIAHINVYDLENQPVEGREICRGTHLYLDAGASHADNYQWSGEGIVSEETAFERIEIAPEESGSYVVRVSNGNGMCADTAMVTFTVKTPEFELPTVLHMEKPNTEYVFDVNIPEGATVEWTFRADKDGSETVTNENKVNLTGDGWVFGKLTQDGCEAYDSCRIVIKYQETYNGGENDGFSLLEDITTVWLEPEFDEVNVCRDNEQRLTARVRGLSRYTYRWYRLINEQLQDLDWTDTTYVVTRMDEAKTGKYFCIVTDRQEKDAEGNYKTYSTDTIEVKLKEGPVAQINFANESDKTDRVCFGSEFQLTAANTNGKLSEESLTYTWEGNTFDLLTEKRIMARPQMDGRYVLTVRDNQGGCVDTAVLQLNMYAPKLKVPNRLFLTEAGMTEILAETGENGTLKWYIDYRNQVHSQTNPGVLNLQRDALVIAEYQEEGCSAFDTTKVFVKWPTTYAGSDDDGFVQSLPELKAYVDPKFPEVCRGNDIRIGLRINPEGRSLKYAWKKVGTAVPIAYEQDLVLPAKSVSDGGLYYCEVTNISEENPLLRTIISDTARVTVLAGPIARISSPDDGSRYCYGAEVTIDASGTENNKESVNDTYTYEWFGTNISYTGKQHVINVVTGSDPRYIVKVSMGACVTYDTLTLDVYRPDVRIKPVVHLTEAGNVQLKVDNPDPAKNVSKWHQYLEGEASAYQTVTADSIDFHVPYDSKIIVERQHNGCSGYDTCEVFVKAGRTYAGGAEDGFVSAGTAFYTQQPQLTDYVCVGETATIWTEAVGNDYYRYEWYKVGEDRPCAEDACCILESVTKEDEGYYYCVITDVNNGFSLTTERVYLNVKERPVTKIIAPTTLVCYGSEVRLEADQTTLKEGVNYTYLWQGLGVKNPTSAQATVQAEKTSEYVLVVGDGDCFMEDTLLLEVERTQLDYQPLYTINEGEAVDLRATLNGKPSTNLTWRVDGDPYPNTSEVHLTNVTRSMNFTIEVSGVCQVVRTGQIQVRNSGAFKGGYDDGFTMPNELPQILDQCSELMGCDQDSAVLWVKALFTEDLVYVWQKFDESQGKFMDFIPAAGQNHVQVWQDTMRFTSITVDDAGRYRCCLKNSYGYSYSREIRLVKGGTPEIATRLNDGAVCEGTLSTFHMGVYVSIPNGGTEQTTGLTYEWYFAKDGINFTRMKPEVEYNKNGFDKTGLKEADEGYYMVKASNYCGVAYDTAFQKIWEAPTFVEQPKDEAVCDAGSITLTTQVQGGGHYGYRLWQVEVDGRKNFVANKRLLYEGTAPEATIPYAGFGDEGYYAWVAWNECDSVRSKPFFIDVEEEIRPVFDYVDTTVCENTRLVLLADQNANIENPTGTLKYYWEKDGERLENSASLRYILSSLSETQKGEYICYAYHSCRAKPIKQYSVNMKSKPRIIQQPTLKNEGGYCLGEEVTIVSNYMSDGVRPVTVAWYYNNSYRVSDDAQLSGSNTNILKIDSVSPSYARRYDVRFTNECGTTISAAANVIVNMPATFTTNGKLPAEVILCSGENRTLQVAASGMSGITYLWMKDGKQVQFGTSASLALKNVDYDVEGQYCCYASNSCNIESAVTCTEVKVITPYTYDVLGGGTYCADEGREVTLSGYQQGVVYTLYRRGTTSESNYQTIQTVDGDTVSTPILSFGTVQAGLYHVVGVAKVGSKSCSRRMNGEISISRAPTPEQFVFHITDPMCDGESRATVTLEGTEVNSNITYCLERWNTRLNGGAGGWAAFGATYKGDGTGHNWPVAEGYYRVMAENTISGCRVQMGDVDTVTSRPYPEVFELLAVNGDTTACEGMESDVVLKLSDSEKGCTYTLFKDDVATDRALSGNLLVWDKVDAGVYTVRAVSSYGCSRRMGHVEVTEVPRLENFLLSSESSTVYCAEEAGQDHVIRLEGSTPGIRYDFYSTGVQDTLSALWGTGGALEWEVTLNGNATYYIVAVDTVENCYYEMPQRAEIEANLLLLSVESPIRVTASTQAMLPVQITGAMNPPTILWKPEEKIASGQGTATITTTVMTEGDRFWVSVDDGFCRRDTFIDVSLVGEVLRADIKAGDCYTSVDTMYLCNGEEVSLCSYVGGGGGSYRFSWLDEFGNSMGNRSKLNVRKSGDGYIVLHVESDITDIATGQTITQVAEDTVRIMFRERPRTLSIENQDLTCVLPGQSADIVLKATEEGVRYQLQHFNTETGTYEAVTDATKVGDGQDWIHSIVYSEETAGRYRVLAVKEYEDDFVCEEVFTATEYRRAPQKFEVSALGTQTYCVDMAMDSIVLSGSEEQVTYRLMRNETIQVTQQAGTGEALLFAGRYGSDAPGKNSYRVVAVLNGCSETMNNEVTIHSLQRPLIKDITGVRDYCATENVAITINDMAAATMLSLYKVGENAAIKSEASSGSEAIQFDFAAGSDKVLTTGQYYIVSSLNYPDQSLTCTDTVKGLKVIAAPEALTAVGSNWGYCEHLDGFDSIRFVGADPDVDYELFDAPKSMNRNSLGKLTHGEGDTLYYDAVLAVPEGVDLQQYYVYAYAGSCSDDKANFKLVKHAAPKDCNLYKEKELLGCVGYGLTMGVMNTEANVKYTLYRMFGDEIDSLTTLSGNLGLITFGHYAEEGTYYVVAINAGGCERKLTQEYVIRPLPEFYKIYTPSAGYYCEGEEGVQLGITGTQDGVTYYLQQLIEINGKETWTLVEGAELLGVGGEAQLFAGYYPEGDYRIITDYCELTMRDTLTIEKRMLPRDVAVTFGGKACVDSTIQIRVPEPESGTTYTLCHNGVPTADEAVTDGEVAWNIAAALEGEYTVMAELNGCQLVLSDTITPGFTVKFGDLSGMKPGMCAEDTTTLYIAADDWDVQANYRLYSIEPDSLMSVGVEQNGQMTFPGVAAGHQYRIVASHLSCETEKGVYVFDAVAIPELRAEDFVVEDCKPDGEATILLKGLTTDYQYTLSGLLEEYVVKDFTGDTLLTKLDNGSYTLVAHDTKTGCYSLPLETTIRRAVPATDTIVSRLAYCEGENGVNIRFSSHTFGVSYVLRNLDGTLVDSIAAASSAVGFTIPLEAGEYIFYREREGLWGGCWLADTFRVEKYPLPNVDLTVRMPETLCETGENTIEIHDSEEHVIYSLKNEVTGEVLDSIEGNGGVVSFVGRKPAGTYRIEMRYKGLCPREYYETFTVHPVPAPIQVTDQQFCLDGTEDDNKRKINVTGLKTDVEYVLYNAAGIELDTISGMIAGYFDGQTTGDYYITGTYLATGCTERVGDLSIHGVTNPQVFHVRNAAEVGDCGDVADIRLDGFEGDSVQYYLYINDLFRVAGPVTAENDEVKFGEFREAGEYKVYAEKFGTCGAWMEGSVVIYAAPRLATLSVTGLDCGEGAVSDVTISATRTVEHWLYFLTNADGSERSETLEGGADVISWSEIAGQAIKAGKYFLYATNPCDSLILLDSIAVETAELPYASKFIVVDDGFYCHNVNKYELKLDQAQQGVTYALDFGGQVQEIDGETRTEFLLAQVENPGLATVFATVDTTGCTYQLDTLRVRRDHRPQEPTVVGDHVCATPESSSIEIKLKDTRLPRVDYFLVLNLGQESEKYVDTIPSTVPLTHTTFDTQSEYGCYYIVMTSEYRHCDLVLDPLCLSEPPKNVPLEGGSRTIDLCEGDLDTIWIEESEVGVMYTLLNEKSMPCGAAVVGNGGRLQVGTVNAAGVYTVLAAVSDDCAITLEDSVTVKINERPKVNVQHEYTYPDGEEGVKLEVLPETTPGAQYALIVVNENNLWKELKTSEEGRRISFDYTYGEGKYIVMALGKSAGLVCNAEDSIFVRKISLTPFRLEVLGTPYKCESTECRTLRLNGSEKGTTYSLYHIVGKDTNFVALEEGTGKAINWGSLCDTGYFYVMGEKRISETAVSRSKMGEDVHLFVSTGIEKFTLRGDIVGYCSDSEPNGKIVLDSSQNTNITYQLYCNGRPVPGKALPGAGGSKLVWDKLEGLDCVENNDVGNVYTVVASDGYCELEMYGKVNIVKTNPVEIRSQDDVVKACTGESAGLTVTAYGCLLSYEWTHNGEVVGNEAGLTIDSVKMEDMGVYECTISNFCNSVKAEPMELNVRQVVTMPEKMKDVLICNDDSRDIELVSGALGENYLWYKVGGDTLSRERILSIKSAMPEKDAGEYICYTWNDCGGLYDTVRVEFNRTPDVTGFRYRRDTICVNSAYEIHLESRDSLVWYFNGVEIVGKHDPDWVMEQVALNQEGDYKVKAMNRCQEKEFDIVKLLVDDTVRIISAPGESKHYCENTAIELTVEATPTERVEYHWYKMFAEIGKGNTYTVVANYTREDGTIYHVDYKNKCSAGRIEHLVYVDRSISLVNIPSPDTVCCSDEEKKMIIIRDQAQSDRSYDTYKWYKRTADGPVLMSESDTLLLDQTLANRGIYYAEVSNVCERVTSPDVDLRIDTLPIITEQPTKVSVCEAGSAVFKVSATGGDLTYRWVMRKKDGTEEYQVKMEADYASSSQWTMERLTVEHDSALIWCIVENKCHYACSDTVMLTVNKNVVLTTDKTLAYLCANRPGDAVKIVVKPEPAIFQSWNYYVTKNGVLLDKHNPRAVYNAAVDTLTFTDPGTYRIYGFETRNSGCVAENSAVEVKVENQEIFRAVLSSAGKTVVCRSDQVTMQLHIEGGQAPWLVDIRRKSDDVTAPELGGEPILVYARDTLFRMNLIHDETFYIASAVQPNDPTACDGDVSGEVGFTIQQPYDTRLQNVKDTTFGSCRDLNLITTFKPTPDISAGQFYVNGELSETSVLAGKPGRYHIVYKSTTSAGCVDSTSIAIRMEELPTGRIYAEKTDLCAGEYTGLYAVCEGAAPFNVGVTVYPYDANGELIGSKRPRPNVSLTNEYVSYQVYNTSATADSIRIYEITSLTDKYGCPFVPDEDDVCQVTMRKAPLFTVQGKHTELTNNKFVENVEDFVVAPDKSGNSDVYFAVSALKDASGKAVRMEAPWNSRVRYVDLDGKEIEINNLRMAINATHSFMAPGSGIYYFTVSDAYCSSTETKIRTVTVLDSAYIQVKAFLEGAYDTGNPEHMKSDIFAKGLVPLKQWTQWPDMGDQTGIDWMTLEIREGDINGDVVFSGEYLLRSDGYLIDRTGRTSIAVPKVNFLKEYWVVVKHRNHLSTGSHSAMKLSTDVNQPTLMDFSVGFNNYVEDDLSKHMKYVQRHQNRTIYALPAGNVLLNSLIAMQNTNAVVLKEEYTPGYYDMDVNFDGIITLPSVLGVYEGRDDASMIFNNRDSWSLIKDKEE